MAIATLYRRNKALILGATGLLCAVLLWDTAARLEWLDPVLISSPLRVLAALQEWAASGLLWRDFRVSMGELVVGFGSAVIVGVPVGMIMGRSWLAETALEPFVWFLYSTPLVAFWPLLIIWFDIGPRPITVLAYLFAVVPIIINTITGVKGVPEILIRCARSLNARPLDVFFKFIAPAALPMIIAGLRLAVGRALIGVVVGELFSGQAGLGFKISNAGARLRFDAMFAALVMVVVVGVLLTQAVRALEGRLASWKA